MKRKDGLPPYWHMSAERSIHTNRECAALNDIVTIRASPRQDDRNHGATSIWDDPMFFARDNASSARLITAC
ncbi:hypothetical protein SAMN05421755_104712 [Nitrosomonas sp. Nm33]|nr:hypothetical protein SAMN05421755_104712 [Nitrosomonas sp. Nm33]